MIPDYDLICALIDQVSKAVPEGGSERDVLTFITRELWDQWCRATFLPIGTVPTPWIGTGSARVYGSETVVVEIPGMASASVALCR